MRGGNWWLDLDDEDLVFVGSPTMIPGISSERPKFGRARERDSACRMKRWFRREWIVRMLVAMYVSRDKVVGA